MKNVNHVTTDADCVVNLQYSQNRQTWSTVRGNALRCDEDGAIHLGQANTDGSWRFKRVATDLVLAVHSGGDYVDVETWATPP